MESLPDFYSNNEKVFEEHEGLKLQKEALLKGRLDFFFERTGKESLKEMQKIAKKIGFTVDIDELCYLYIHLCAYRSEENKEVTEEICRMQKKAFSNEYFWQLLQIKALFLNEYGELPKFKKEKKWFF